MKISKNPVDKYGDSASFSYFCNMHRYIAYISDLLFLHDCVIIPDFGGFICNYQSACIDEKNGFIYPPSKTILFNRNLTLNDGLLANWIVCKENISYDKAIKQIEFFCEDLKIRLNQREKIDFGDIGSFYTDRRFHILFEPTGKNFLVSAFGMEKIEALRFPARTKKIRQIELSPVAASSTYINANSSNWLQRSLKYGAAAAVIAGIVVTTQMGWIQFKKVKDNTFIANTSTLQPLAASSESEASFMQAQRIKISPDYDYVSYDPLADADI